MELSSNRPRCDGLVVLVVREISLVPICEGIVKNFSNEARQISLVVIGSVLKT